MTNLFNHLKINHKVVYDEVTKEQKAQKSASTSASATATPAQSSIRDSLSHQLPKTSRNNGGCDIHDS